MEKKFFYQTKKSLNEIKGARSVDVVRDLVGETDIVGQAEILPEVEQVLSDANKVIGKMLEIIEEVTEEVADVQ